MMKKILHKRSAEAFFQQDFRLFFFADNKRSTGIKQRHRKQSESMMKKILHKKSAEAFFQQDFRLFFCID